MLGDGGLPVLPSHLLPHQLIAGRKFEELGWGLQKQAGRTYRKQAMPGNVERESGKKTADCDVWVQMVPERYPCITSSKSFLQRLPLGFYSQRTWDWKHSLWETRIDDFLTSRLVKLNKTSKADVVIQMVGRTLQCSWVLSMCGATLWSQGCMVWSGMKNVQVNHKLQLSHELCTPFICLKPYSF